MLVSTQLSWQFLLLISTFHTVENNTHMHFQGVSRGSGDEVADVLIFDGAPEAHEFRQWAARREQ